jgi:hypothetical protein
MVRAAGAASGVTPAPSAARDPAHRAVGIVTLRNTFFGLVNVKLLGGSLQGLRTSVDIQVAKKFRSSWI